MENSKLLEKKFQIAGMSCPGCEMKIGNALGRMEGVVKVKASLAGSSVTVSYDPSLIKPAQLRTAIVRLGYEVVGPGKGAPEPSLGKSSVTRVLGMGIIALALYIIIKTTAGFNFIPRVEQSVGLGMLFVIGILTSLHCVAMCGGINLSQCIKVPENEADLRHEADSSNGSILPPKGPGIQNPATESQWPKFKPSILYNGGRVISYTIIGGIVGALGSVIGFSGTAKGLIAIIGGLFMVVIGVKMLDIFPWLRRVNIVIPQIWSRLFKNKFNRNSNHHGPLYIGILNGLMPCGPLQTIQLYALGTGSFLNGAAAMFLFSLGTVPLMFGFGAASTFLSAKFTRNMLKISAAIVIALGMIMVNRGLNLSGVAIAPISSPADSAGNIAKIGDGIQTVTTRIEPGRYQPFAVQSGIPVRWVIKARAEDLNGCNNPLTVPKYNIQKKLVPGDNIIEFTPREDGIVTYTCWMGMITGFIKVVPDISRISGKDLDQANSDTGNGLSSPDNGLSRLGGGNCCPAGVGDSRFSGGKVPAGDIQIAKITGDTQEVTIRVDDQGYSPAAVILQKGLKAKIKFDPEKLSPCNYMVVFPEYNGQLDLSRGQTETPGLTVNRDFTFHCRMGMLHGYVKVVDDVNNVNINEVRREIENHLPAGGGCCGR